MIKFIDPIPPILNLLVPEFKSQDISIYGNNFPKNQPTYPAVLVKQTGGLGYYRIQLLARAIVDFDAMGTLIRVMNYLEENAQMISDIRVLWCERESNPEPSIDEDTGLHEAWCYMRLEAVESNSMG